MRKTRHGFYKGKSYLPSLYSENVKKNVDRNDSTVMHLNFQKAFDKP